MNDDPLVSVVIPSYNRAKYIAETIESVLDQTYRNIEVIVIDDGSTDNTGEVVSQYLPRIKYIRQANAERGASRNHGLSISKGEYIAFLDSDDVWLPTKVEHDLRIFSSSPRIGLVCSNAVQIDAAGRQLKLLRPKAYSGTVTDRLIVNNFVLMATHLAKTAAVRQLNGFREERELSGSEDWELWVRLSTSVEFFHSNEVTARIRTHDENTMGDATGMSRSMSYALDIMESSDYLSATQRSRLNRSRGVVCLINAINYCSARNYKTAISELKNAFLKYPAVCMDPRFGYTFFRMVFRR